MRKPISNKTKLLVAQRAAFRCEYCRVHEDDMFIAFEIDHVISIKHGGGNEIDNLAYACPHCNQHKGTDLTTFLETYEDIVPLFNPRQHNWFDHFEAIAGEIVPISRIGKASVKIFRFNEPDLIILRRILTQANAYP